MYNFRPTVFQTDYFLKYLFCSVFDKPKIIFVNELSEIKKYKKNTNWKSKRNTWGIRRLLHCDDLMNSIWSHATVSPKTKWLQFHKNRSRLIHTRLVRAHCTFRSDYTVYWFQILHVYRFRNSESVFRTKRAIGSLLIAKTLTGVLKKSCVRTHKRHRVKHRFKWLSFFEQRRIYY